MTFILLLVILLGVLYLMATFDAFKAEFAKLKESFVKIDADIAAIKAKLAEFEGSLTKAQVDEIFAELESSVSAAKVIDDKTPEDGE